MLKYIEEFQHQINNLNNEIINELDKYKLIELRYKLDKLTDSYNYFLKMIFNNFTEQQIAELTNVTNFADFQKEINLKQKQDTKA